MKPNTIVAIAIANIILLLIAGTIIYQAIEGWEWVDAFYFTGITLTTIGYGDLVPTHATSKIFTVFFALVGIIIFFVALGNIMTIYLRKEQSLLGKNIRKYERMIMHRKKKKWKTP
ncbi:MAG: potassium channel family protein [Candidatus Aenigmatarchaeota archaeon]